MKKDFLIIGGLFLLIVVLLILGNSLNVFLKGTAPQAVSTTKVKVGDLQITAEVAKTPISRSKGLSQRQYLAQDSGMLFVFEKVDRYSFWMKDVKFPLDIVWINNDKKIADIFHNAQPEPEKPDNLLRIYQPAEPVQYILEVLGGTAAKYNLRIGDKVDFSAL